MIKLHEYVLPEGIVLHKLMDNEASQAKNNYWFEQEESLYQRKRRNEYVRFLGSTCALLLAHLHLNY
jgi:hypothetical protein